MTDIVINARFGGFGLSPAALAALSERKGTPPLRGLDVWNIARDDDDLVAVVRELGDGASGGFARLVVVTIPDDVEWSIDEYDGYERVAEAHRTWGADGTYAVD